MTNEDEAEIATEAATTEASPATPTVMTVGDLASYLQVSKKTIYTLANAGDIPVMKIGNDWRFYRPLVDKWLVAKSLETYSGPKIGAGEGDAIT